MSPDPLTTVTGFLALGDSYTIGEGVAAGQRWPNQLVAALRAEGLVVDDPTIIATTGWSTDELAAAMDAAGLVAPFALVSLLIGVNNQYRGRPLDNYRDEFRELLARAIELAGADANRVVVVSIPDWGVTGYAIANARDAAEVAAEIDAYNAAAAAIVAEHAVAWVDITDLGRSHPDELVDDGLHPSGDQYARWVQRILPHAIAALRRD